MSGLLGSCGLSVVRSLSSWFYHRRTLVALSAAGGTAGLSHVADTAAERGATLQKRKAGVSQIDGADGATGRQ